MLRLWLDCMLSRDVAVALRTHGHDVVACQEEPPDKWHLSDEAQLERAAEERRVVVTYNVADFVHLDRQWTAAGRTHAGMLLVHSKSISVGDKRMQINALHHFLASSKEMATFQQQVLFLKKS